MRPVSSPLCRVQGLQDGHPADVPRCTGCPGTPGGRLCCVLACGDTLPGPVPARPMTWRPPALPWAALFLHPAPGQWSHSCPPDSWGHCSEVRPGRRPPRCPGESRPVTPGPWSTSVGATAAAHSRAAVQAQDGSGQSQHFNEQGVGQQLPRPSSGSRLGQLDRPACRWPGFSVRVS